MKPYLNAVMKSEYLIFSTIKNIVGRGVFEEVKTALKYLIPILVIEKVDNEFNFSKLKSIKIVNEKNWSDYAETELAMI